MSKTIRRNNTNRYLTYNADAWRYDLLDPRRRADAKKARARATRRYNKALCAVGGSDV